MQAISAWLDRKPYKEVYDGRMHEKVSLQRTHGLLEGRIFSLLYDWAIARGFVAVEWRVYLDHETTLVPDVAYISDERLAGLSEEAREKPPFAPDIAVEIRSPGDRKGAIARKIELYLAFGSTLLVDVDPPTRAVTLITAEGSLRLGAGDTIQHPAFAGLAIPVDQIFAPLDRVRTTPPG